MLTLRTTLSFSAIARRFASTRALSAAQVAAYERDGFLVLPNFVSRSAIDGIRKEAEKIVDEFDAKEASIFTTNDQARKSDEYFLTSGDKVRCFLEEHAYDSTGKLGQAKKFSVNKIGHALHSKNDVFRRFCSDPKVGAVARSIGFRKPACVQTMYIFKSPRIGGAVSMHQDDAFLHTEPQSVVGFWFAVQDSTRDNGCMFAIPGSHKQGTARRFVLNAKKDGTEWRPATTDIVWDEKKLVPLEASAGSMILLHGSVAHCSYQNTSDMSRHAFTMHAVETDGARWEPDNWMPQPDVVPMP